MSSFSQVVENQSFRTSKYICHAKRSQFHILQTHKRNYNKPFVRRDRRKGLKMNDVTALTVGKRALPVKGWTIVCLAITKRSNEPRVPDTHWKDSPVLPHLGLGSTTPPASLPRNSAPGQCRLMWKAREWKGWKGRPLVDVNFVKGKRKYDLFHNFYAAQKFMIA